MVITDVTVRARDGRTRKRGVWSPRTALPHWP
jgi:hypothetical protein